MRRSDLIMKQTTDGNSIRHTVQMFVGPDGRVDLIGELAKTHKVEQQDIPGLWRIDDGPEITTNQLLSIARANSRKLTP